MPRCFFQGLNLEVFLDQTPSTSRTFRADLRRLEHYVGAYPWEIPTKGPVDAAQKS